MRLSFLKLLKVKLEDKESNFRGLGLVRGSLVSKGHDKLDACLRSLVDN